MSFFLLMVTDQGRFDYYNTDVSCIISNLNWFIYIYAGSGVDGSLERVPFGRINNGSLVYESGESQSTIYPGIPTTIISS